MSGPPKEWQHKFYLRFENDCVRHSHTVIWESGALRDCSVEGLTACDKNLILRLRPLP